VATGQAKLWLALEVVGAACKVGLAWWLIPSLGLIGLPLSLLMTGLLLLLLNIICLDRAVGIKIPATRYAAMAVGLAVIAACFWLPTLGTLGAVATAAILTANVAMCVKKYRSHS
jgi:O-antigen/teichoic acid export membrane protein